jgi:hypothetical protein
MNRVIKFRFWSGSKMFTEVGGVMACLAQQILFDGSPSKGLAYDHVGKHGAAFMQFTGLKDKNGREIYEGDKVFVVIRQTVGEDFRGEAEIEWGDTFGCWMLDFPNLGQSMGMEAAEEIEVLGNIHEGCSPHALGKDKP